MRLAVIVLAATSALALQRLPPSSDWMRANPETRRLPPARFAGLPAAARIELERLGCLIPQPFTARREQPENVIRGHFISAAATDWAALCSREQHSSILVFHGGGGGKIDEIASQADADRLQLVEPGRIGYSRAIFVAAPADIRRHNSAPEATRAVLDHDGIGDAFIEKASIIWYWSGSRWEQLSGANQPPL